jgi:hypothetical protein
MYQEKRRIRNNINFFEICGKIAESEGRYEDAKRNWASAEKIRVAYRLGGRHEPSTLERIATQANLLHERGLEVECGKCLTQAQSILPEDRYWNWFRCYCWFHTNKARQYMESWKEKWNP